MNCNDSSKKKKINNKNRQQRNILNTDLLKGWRVKGTMRTIWGGCGGGGANNEHRAASIRCMRNERAGG